MQTLAINLFHPPSVGEIIITMAGVLGSLAAIMAMVKKLRLWIINYITKQVQKMAATLQIQEKQLEITEKIDRVLAELSLDGGKTTKDWVKKITESLYRVESRQQAIFDSPDVKVGRFETDALGKIVYCNKQLCYMLGRTPDDLKESGWFNFIDRHQKSDVVEEWFMCMDENRDFIRAVSMIHNDGLIIHVEIQTTKMKNDRGEIIGWLGTVIEARQQA